MRTAAIVAGVVLGAATLCVGLLAREGDYRRPQQFESINALNRPDCRFGVFKGAGGESVARRLFPAAEIVCFEDGGEASAAMLGGRLEGFVGAEHMLNLFCREYPLRFRVLDEPLDRQPARVIVARQNGGLLAEINRYIDKYKREGIYDDMFLRWCLAEKYVPIPEIAEASSNGTLRVTMSGLVEPSNFIDENGNLTGYDVEFALRLGLALGRKVNFQLIPERAPFGELTSGATDAIIDFSCGCSTELPEGVVASEGYLDSDLKVLIAEEQPGLNRKLEELMLEGTRFGVADRFFSDVRVQLFVNGILNTAAITILSVLLGFGLAWSVRKSERYWRPRATLHALDAAIALIRWTPPLVLLLIFHSALMAWASPWITAVAAFAVWLGAYLEPVATCDPLAWLPVLRLRVPILLHWTSVVGYISVFDLTMAVDLVCGRSCQAIVPMLAVALTYGLLAWTLDRVLAHLERKVQSRL